MNRPGSEGCGQLGLFSRTLLKPFYRLHYHHIRLGPNYHRRVCSCAEQIQSIAFGDFWEIRGAKSYSRPILSGGPERKSLFDLVSGEE
jgi:hypothetical protein